MKKSTKNSAKFSKYLLLFLLTAFVSFFQTNTNFEPTRLQKDMSNPLTSLVDLEMEFLKAQQEVFSKKLTLEYPQPLPQPLSDNILYTNKDTASEDLKPLHNSVFKHKKRKAGYLRIPSFTYMGCDSMCLSSMTKGFQQIINKFKKQKNTLVIEQLQNPSGYVYYLYALASMLSDNALLTPLRRISPTPKHVLLAQNDLKVLDQIRNQDDIEIFFGANELSGIPLDLNFIKHRTISLSADGLKVVF